MLLQTIRSWDPDFEDATPESDTNADAYATDIHTQLASLVRALPRLLVSRNIQKALQQKDHAGVVDLFQYALKKAPLFLRLEEGQGLGCMAAEIKWVALEQVLGQPFVDFIQAYSPRRLRRCFDGNANLVHSFVDALARGDFVSTSPLCRAVWRLLHAAFQTSKQASRETFQACVSGRLLSLVSSHGQVDWLATCMRELREFYGGDESNSQAWSRLSRAVGDGLLQLQLAQLPLSRDLWLQPSYVSRLQWWLTDSGHPVWNDDDWLLTQGGGGGGGETNPLARAQHCRQDKDAVVQMVQSAYDKWYATSLPALSVACGLDTLLLPDLAPIVWHYVAHLAPTSTQLKKNSNSKRCVCLKISPIAIHCHFEQVFVFFRCFFNSFHAFRAYRVGPDINMLQRSILSDGLGNGDSTGRADCIAAQI